MLPRISARRIDKEGILSVGLPTNTPDRKLRSFAMCRFLKGLAVEAGRFLHRHAERDDNLAAPLVAVLAAEQ